MNANARPTSGGVDPCTLVTQAEAAAAIGVPVTAPARSDSFGGGATTGEMESVCIYGDILSFTTPRLTITVGQKDPSHADNWSATRYWGREKDNHPSFLEPVANLGDEAMKRASDPKERVIIYVLKQDVVFNIDVQNTTAPLEDALGLATKAVRRLP
ncbi:MAG: hypothetical protein M3Y58_18275 [Chloroflexota bacterium]|nr:hypothetical protein [Chloroflexota bacterium]